MTAAEAHELYKNAIEVPRKAITSSFRFLFSSSKFSVITCSASITSNINFSSSIAFSFLFNPFFPVPMTVKQIHSIKPLNLSTKQNEKKGISDDHLSIPYEQANRCRKTEQEARHEIVI